MGGDIMSYILNKISIRTNNTKEAVRSIEEIWRDISTCKLPILFDNEGNLSRCSKKAWEKVWNDTTSGKIRIKFTQGYESIVPKQYIAYKKAH